MLRLLLLLVGLVLENELAGAFVFYGLIGSPHFLLQLLQLLIYCHPGIELQPRIGLLLELVLLVFAGFLSRMGGTSK